MPAIAGKKLPIETCNLCGSFSTKRLTTLERHVIDVHGSTLQALYDAKNGKGACACGCGTETSWRGYRNGYARFAVGHNASIYSGAYDAEEAERIAKTRGSNWRGATSPWKGKTKHDDPATAARAAATSIGRKRALQEGRLIPWNRGLTAATDKRVEAAAKAVEADFASGKRSAWHAGLNATKNETLAGKNAALRARYAAGDLVAWHKGKTQADEPRLKKLWQHRDPLKEYKNVRFTHQEIEAQLAHNVHIALERIDGYRRDRWPGIVVRCRQCTWTAKVSLLFARSDRCPVCHPTGSVAQHQIASWIEGLGVSVGRNVRGIIGSNKELDIYAPSSAFAVEFNGLYYHNEAAGKDQNYHQDKSDRCAALGISLFHVFEDEWRDRRPIVESMIANRLGLSARRIDARRCSVVPVGAAVRAAFFSTNHIDGDVSASSAVGLELGGELVAAMSFRRPFHRSHAGSLEVARACGVLGASVRGGLSRLTAAARKTAAAQGLDALLTYVDTRFGSSGASWAAAGWSAASSTPPRFWWTDGHQRFNRFRHRANAAAGLSEADVADAAGVVRIYGCRNAVMTART